MKRRFGLIWMVVILSGDYLAAFASPMETAEVHSLLRTIDTRTGNQGDFTAQVFVEQKEKGKTDVLYDLLVYRRDADDKQMLLFARPKSEAGKGYLRLEKNLFLFDPTVGKWDRRTERERIGGTTSQHSDYDQSHWLRDFEPTYVGEELLGHIPVHHLEMRAKASSDAPYPLVHLWVGKHDGNMLKQEQRSISGRLMRTAYYPKWGKLYSDTKHADVYFAKEVRIYDEIEKGNQTMMVVRNVDLHALAPNMFTKAWIESKSR